MTEPWPWPVDLMIPLLPPSKVVASWQISAILLLFSSCNWLLDFSANWRHFLYVFLKDHTETSHCQGPNFVFFYFLNPKTNGDDWCYKEYLNLLLEPFDSLKTSWSLKKQKLIKAERSENLSNISSKWIWREMIWAIFFIAWNKRSKSELNSSSTSTFLLVSKIWQIS